MKSEIELANLALAHLGQAPMAAINDNSANAVTFKQVYGAARDEVLRQFDWPFARIIAALTASTATLTGWTYVYTKPSDCLAVWSVFEDTARPDPDAVDYLVSGSIIGANSAAPYIRYSKTVTDVSLFDPAFATALSYRLAELMGPAISVDDARVAAVAQKYLAFLSEARRLNADRRNRRQHTPSGVRVR